MGELVVGRSVKTFLGFSEVVLNQKLLVSHLIVLFKSSFNDFRRFCIHRSFQKKEKIKKVKTSMCDIYDIFVFFLKLFS